MAGTKRCGRLAVTFTLIGISAIAGCGGTRLKTTTSHTALLYGDSLSWESAVNNAHCPRNSRCHTETIQELMAVHRNWRLVVRAFPGTAVCDWLKSLPHDLVSYKPDVVILQTEGDDETACMDAPGTHSPYPIASAGVYAKYRSDLDTFFAEVTATGAKVIGVAPIMTTDRKFNQQVTTLNRIMIREAAKFPKSTTTSRPGNAVTDNGRFTFKKQCLASETAAQGCTNGLIPVRELAGLHFCPVGFTFPAGCPVYSSGAFRFGENILDALISASNNP